jgi:hypothetical protein
MIQHSRTSPEFAGRSSQKNELFSKNRGLAAFVAATPKAFASRLAWQAPAPQCITVRIAASEETARNAAYSQRDAKEL